MYILSQNKEKILNLANITAIDVTKNYGGKKEEKYGLYANGGFIALYADKGTAQKMLVKILSAIENDEKIYELE
ncbi:MAG: hypothetical protein K2K06_09530 [Oscillospiraceae bacterium]|nr:hypothetical protein [Oscillospiraceae bacterium]